MRAPRKRLNWKLTGAVIAIAVAGALLMHRGTEALRRTAQLRDQCAVTRQLAEQINSYVFDKASGATRALAQTPEVLAVATKRTEPDNPEVLIVLNTAMALFDAAIVYVLDQEANVVACTPHDGGKTLTGDNYAFRPYYTRAIRGEHSVYPALGTTTGKRGLYFSSPVRARTGHTPIGVIVIKIPLAETDGLLAKREQPTALLSPDGIVFSSNVPDWLFHAAYPHTDDTLERVRASRQFADRPLTALAVMLDEDNVLCDGRTHAVVREPIAMPGWHVVTLEKIDAQYPVYAVNRRVVGIGLLALLSLSIVVVVLASNIVKRKRAEAALQKAHDQLAEWNRSLESRVAERTAAVRNLLDNAGQGFLTLGADLLVDSEYSRECDDMFGPGIAGRAFPALVYPQDEEERDYLQNVLSRVFAEDDEGKRDGYLRLLPDEAEIAGRNVRLEFRILLPAQHDNPQVKVMVILTDITSRRQLENEMEQEKKTLQMVVKAIVNRGNLMFHIDRYRHFCRTGIKQIVRAAGSTEEATSEIFNRVHTFKGNFALLNLANVAAHLHAFESQLAAFRKQTSSTADELDAFLGRFAMQQWLDKDLEILERTLGAQFLAPDTTLTVSAQTLREIEDKLVSLFPQPECKPLLTELRKLRYKPFRELLASYPQFVTELAERLEKPLNPLVVEGGEMLVDPDKYISFAQSLVHVFRNIPVHGIEDASTRRERHKEIAGTVTCRTDLADGRIALRIADDGGGIDIEQLRTVAVEKGLMDGETADGVPESELLDYVFMGDLSTAADVSQVAGRGFGMNAVKDEVDKLGGEIRVSTVQGKGTEFLFLLPHKDIAEV